MGQGGESICGEIGARGISYKTIAIFYVKGDGGPILEEWQWK